MLPVVVFRLVQLVLFVVDYGPPLALVSVVFFVPAHELVVALLLLFLALGQQFA